MKKAKISVLTLAAALLLSACAGSSAVPETSSAAETAAAETEAASSLETLVSPDGWSLTYDPAVIRMEEKDGTRTFSYTAYPEGEATAAISYVTGKQPLELLYEKTSDIDDSRITRSEGYYGADSAWAHYYLIAAKEGENLHEDYTAIEHNGGCVLIYSRTRTGSDEEQAELMSDTMADTMSTLSFPDGCIQQEYAYRVGTYEHTYTEEIEGEETTVTDTITLYADHTGYLEFQDTVPCVWTSYEILTDYGSTRQEFTVEGDLLYLQEGEDWTEFQRLMKP